MKWRRRIMRSLAVVGLAVVLLGTAFYLRPLDFLFFYRDAVLWSRGVESGTARIGDHRLHYLSQGEGRPLVILPGLLARAADASPLMNAFARDRRAIA